MPIYPEHRLIHIHIPKTGGTAIADYFHAIGDLQRNPVFWVGQERKDGRWYEYQHLAMQELQCFANPLLQDYDSFAVVRNPYARLVSDYLWRQQVRRYFADSAVRFFDSFDAFLRAIPRDMDARWRDHARLADQREANFLIHVRPQYQYVFDAEGRCLVDDILRFETLGHDMNRLLARYGLSTSAVTTPGERDLAAYYDRQRLDLVNEIYARDFERFSYQRL